MCKVCDCKLPRCPLNSHAVDFSQWQNCQFTKKNKFWTSFLDKLFCSYNVPACQSFSLVHQENDGQNPQTQMKKKKHFSPGQSDRTLFMLSLFIDIFRTITMQVKLLKMEAKRCDTFKDCSLGVLVILLFLVWI